MKAPLTQTGIPDANDNGIVLSRGAHARANVMERS